MSTTLRVIELLRVSDEVWEGTGVTGEILNGVHPNVKRVEEFEEMFGIRGCY